MTSALRAWWSAARPKTLWASVAPVLMGTAVAAVEGAPHLPAAAAALACALLIQVGTNLANDYFDARKGADTAARIGPRRALQEGLLSAGAVRAGFAICFLLAVLLGAYLLARGGWPILLIGLGSVALGLLYTGGPAPLAYRGLGDLFAFLCFGPVAVAGTAYVQTLAWSAAGLWGGVAAGGFSLALLTVNNFRDMVGDARAGKRTLVVRLGPAFARAELAAAIGFAALAPLAMIAWLQVTPLLAAPALLAGLSLPGILRAVAEEPGEDPAFGARMNGLLARVGRLELLYALLFSAALLI
jgi:1,4-dihydroxy-2-naphthoate octaprenyltransferase